MKQIIKFRWLVLTAWIVIASMLFFFAPNLSDLVAEKGQITVPDGYTSQEAEQLLEEMSDEGGENNASTVLVFHDPDGLDASKKDEVSEAIEQLQENKDKLALSNLVDFTEGEEVAEQTVSEDDTTILVPFQISLEKQDIEHARDNIYETVENIDIEHHLTGEEFIEQDIITNSEEGLKKTEFITVGLILIILFIVFKSFLAPFIPLLTVGISYLAAQGVVSILADTVNFPLSTFTQIFMVAVMFGIGTDYCILLISRFKEEMAEGESIKDAVIKTYQAAGKTVFFAGLAVLIGFSTIGLSTFSLYQSAVAVAVGVAVVLIALATLVPFFLVTLGKNLFWPFHKNVAHNESKLWKSAGNFSWARPIFAVLIVIIIVTPALLTYNGDKSYDSLAEIGDEYDTVQGFNLIADKFGPGQTMPTTVVMTSDKPLDSAKDYQDIESISQELSTLDGVKEVRSATRPAGEVIEDFLVEKQTGQLADGIEQSTDGLTEIQDGLDEAASELKEASPQLDEAKNGINDLMDGTQAANDGIGEIRDALKQIENGIEQGSSGAGEIKSNLQDVKDNLSQTIAGNKEILGGYEQIAEGLETFGGNSDSLDPNDIDKLIDLLNGVKETLATNKNIAINAQPALEDSKEFNQTYEGSIQQINGTIEGIKVMKEKLGNLGNVQKKLQNEVIVPMKELNASFSKTIDGQEQLSDGINQLIAGINDLQSGLNEASNGQGEVTEQLPDLRDGLSEIYGGQDELKGAFTTMQDQLDELSDGLGASTDGLNEINNGLSDVQSYLEEIELDSNKPVVIIPKEVLENEDFIEGTEPYISDDKEITKFEVVLEHSPYSTEAIQMMNDIDNQANDAKQDTVFHNADPKLGGISSTNNDLQNISDEDYSRTVMFMIAGIFIVLVILLRSLIMPLYLIGSLVVTYFATMGFTELIFVNIFGHDGLTWAVPFFTFVILMALGIDYSIFLMDRFSEYKNGDIKEALISAMKNMGTVIISAVVILGGTFAAMLPSGVLSLLQIATAVIIGLLLYAFVMLPLFIPVMVRLFGKANWWPFKK